MNAPGSSRVCAVPECSRATPSFSTYTLLRDWIKAHRWGSAYVPVRKGDRRRFGLCCPSHAREFMTAIAMAFFVVAASGCALHASIDTECWYAPMQPPPATNQSNADNESNG